MQIEDALDRYVVQLQADGRSPHTIRQYRRHIRLLTGWLRDGRRSANVRDIGHEVLAEFLASPTATQRADGAKRKATSANGLRSSVRTFFGFVHAAGYATTNAARLVRRARCAPPPPRGLSREEQDRLLAVLDAALGEEGERDRVLFRLMLATGIRVGSALALDVEDVDLERGELYLRSTKGDRPMTVFYNDRIRTLLGDHIGDRATGPLFTSRHRRRMSARQTQRRLALWLAKAGCRRASPHALRHSFGQAVYERTRDPFIVQAAMGHRSLASTQVYVTPACGGLRGLIT